MFNRAHASHRNQFGRFNTYGTILDPSDVFWDDYQPSARMAMDEMIYTLFNNEKLDYIKKNPEARMNWEDALIGDLVGILPGKVNSKGYGMGRKQGPLPMTEKEILKAEIAQYKKALANSEFAIDPKALSNDELTTANNLINQNGISIPDSNPIIAAASLAVLRRMNEQGISSLGHIGTNAGGRRRDTTKSKEQTYSDALDYVSELVSGHNKSHGGVNAGLSTNVSHSFPVVDVPELADSRPNYSEESANLNGDRAADVGLQKKLNLEAGKAFLEMKLNQLVRQESGNDSRVDSDNTKTVIVNTQGAPAFIGKAMNGNGNGNGKHKRN